MKTTRLLVLAISILLVLNASVCPLFAEAPTTPKILFTSAAWDGNYEIYSMNPDGSEQVNLTQHRANDANAVWSPTGEQILFESDRGGNRVVCDRDLYLMDPDGSNVRRVFKKEAGRLDPTWSPDGERIAYEYVDWGTLKTTIHIAILGEQEEEPVMKGFFPAWSPDGTEIAYTTYLEGIGHARRVTLIDIRTGKKKLLLPKKAMDWQNQPSWSPAGDKLVFSWNKHPLPPDHNPLIDAFPLAWKAKETIYIVNRDGTDLKQLVDEAGPAAWSPTLSPNGEELLYTQDVNSFMQIFKLDINSGIRTQLTHIGPRNFGGDWFDPAYALPVSPQPQLLTTTWGKVKIKQNSQ